MTPNFCPFCGADMQGDEIPVQWRHMYGGESHYSRLHAHEVSGVHDGVLFWSCPDCLKAWPRFDSETSIRHARDYNSALHIA